LNASSRWGWLALILLLWSLGLQSRALTRPDEGRYAEIGREMAVSGDWVTPHLNGIPYYEKPPLQYWATAASIRLLGPTPLASRLWTALTGLLGIIASAFFAQRLFGSGAAQRTPWILMGTWYYGALGHINTLDMGVAVWMFIAVGGFLLAQQERSRAWMTLAWIAAALGFLSKGLMALALPGATLVLYTLFTRDTHPWKRLYFLPGFPLFLLITVPWFWLAYRVHPEFLWFFFVHEQFDRYTTTIHQRVEPVWYFLPILLAGLLPWTGTALRALRDALFHPRTRGFSAPRFLAIYAVFIVFFFSLSGSKLPDYILPAFPVLALLVGRHLSLRPGPMPVSPHYLLALAGLILMAGAGLLSFPAIQKTGIHFDLDLDMVEEYRHFALWIGLAGLLCVTGAMWSRSLRHLPIPSLRILGVTALAATQLLLLGSNSLAPTQSGAPLVAQIGPSLRAASHLYSLDTYDQTLDFYLQRTVIPVAYTDEMAFGLSLEPQRAIPTLAAFKPIWEQDRRAVAIVPPTFLPQLRQNGFPFRVLFQDSHRVIVARS
jgi:4-amino-4-deoxy-L-arabinose transferase and related glycosyltransferases of PMT family